MLKNYDVRMKKRNGWKIYYFASWKCIAWVLFVCFLFHAVCFQCVFARQRSSYILTYLLTHTETDKETHKQTTICRSITTHAGCTERELRLYIVVLHSASIVAYYYLYCFIYNEWHCMVNKKHMVCSASIYILICFGCFAISIYCSIFMYLLLFDRTKCNTFDIASTIIWKCSQIISHLTKRKT